MPDFLRLGAIAAIAAGLAAPGFAQTEAETGEEPAAEAAEAEAAPVEFDADTVVARVDGTDITLGLLIAIRQNLPQQYQSLPGEVLLEGLTEQVARQLALAEAAKTAGLEDRRDVQLAIDARVSGVLADTYLREEISKRVTEEAVLEAYEDQYINADPIPEVRAAHILVDTREEADEIKAKLDGGEEFAALAAEHGTDGTAQKGGDLGYFVHEQMVPEFADAAFAMEPGQISEPVESPFGWHLIQLNDRRDREPPALQEVFGDIATELTGAAEEAVISEITDGIEIERLDTGIPAEAIKDDALLTAE
ncbi:MAG: peptidylprolyl isomerase [Pseudomonadota bacterium]